MLWAYCIIPIERVRMWMKGDAKNPKKVNTIIRDYQ